MGTGESVGAGVCVGVGGRVGGGTVASSHDGGNSLEVA